MKTLILEYENVIEAIEDYLNNKYFKSEVKVKQLQLGGNASETYVDFEFEIDLLEKEIKAGKK